MISKLRRILRRILRRAALIPKPPPPDYKTVLRE